MFVLFFLGAALVGGCLHAWLGSTPWVQTLLMYILVVSVGGDGVWAFIGHMFKSDEVARSIGWPEGNPFQKEVAWANLAFGVAGIMCWWFHGEFWLATIIAKSVFLLGAFTEHVRDLLKTKNVSINNAGPIMYTDLGIPILLFALYFAA